MTPDESQRAAEPDSRGPQPTRRTEWDRVKAQHAKIVQALNDTPVSLTIRSAEGLAMFQGLSDPLTNGKVHELLEQGHLASVTQALGEPVEDEDERADATAAAPPGEQTAG